LISKPARTKTTRLCVSVVVEQRLRSYSGGPTGYRLMLKRQEIGEKMFPPAEVETVISMLTAAHPDGPASTWEVLREVIAKGRVSLDRRLEESGPLTPERFNLLEANERLARLLQHRRFA